MNDQIEPPQAAPARPRGRGWVSTPALVVAVLAVAVALAFIVAPHANPNPDGLEKVAMDHGLDSAARDHAMRNSPLAHYGIDGVDDTTLSTGLAGLAGIAATFAIASGAMLLVRVVRRRGEPAERPPASA